MERDYKEGDYIRYKIQYPGNDQVFHGGGTVEGVTDKNGKKQYIVAEGNGGQNMKYVDPQDILTLLND